MPSKKRMKERKLLLDDEPRKPHCKGCDTMTIREFIDCVSEKFSWTIFFVKIFLTLSALILAYREFAFTIIIPLVTLMYLILRYSVLKSDPFTKMKCAPFLRRLLLLFFFVVYLGIVLIIGALLTGIFVPIDSNYLYSSLPDHLPKPGVRREEGTWSPQRSL